MYKMMTLHISDEPIMSNSYLLFMVAYGFYLSEGEKKINDDKKIIADLRMVFGHFTLKINYSKISILIQFVCILFQIKCFSSKMGFFYFC